MTRAVRNLRQDQPNEVTPRDDFFGKRVDYELEIETAHADTSAERWTRQLQEWGIIFHPQPLTKFARLLALMND